MKLFHRLAAIAAIFAQKEEPPPQEAAALRAAARDLADRWARARKREPELLGDVIRLGGILTAEPFEDGQVADLSPNRILYEKGRRDLALQLCALMGVDHTEMTILMETNDAQDLDR